MVRQPVEQRSGEPLRPERLRPFVEWQIARHHGEGSESPRRKRPDNSSTRKHWRSSFGSPTRQRGQDVVVAPAFGRESERIDRRPTAAPEPHDRRYPARLGFRERAAPAVWLIDLEGRSWDKPRGGILRPQCTGGSPARCQSGERRRRRSFDADAQR